MPKARSIQILLLLIGMGIFLPLFGADQSNDNLIKVTLEPRFPAALANEGMTEGHAIFLVVIDNQGTLRDHLLIEASHPLFGRAVEEVISRWDYHAATVGGERINVLQQVRVDFHNKGTFVVGLNTPSTIIMSRDLTRFGPTDDLIYQVAELKELDQLPEAVQQVPPRLRYPEMIPEEGLQIVYRFFIDEEGDVRIPWIDEEQFQHVDESILDATYHALMQWRFTPPTVGGKKVVTEATQSFLFVSEKSKLAELQP